MTCLTFGSVVPQSPVVSSAQSWVVVEVVPMFQSWSPPLGAVKPVPVAVGAGGTLGVTCEAPMDVAPHCKGSGEEAVQCD